MKSIDVITSEGKKTTVQVLRTLTLYGKTVLVTRGIPADGWKYVLTEPETTAAIFRSNTIKELLIKVENAEYERRPSRETFFDLIEKNLAYLRNKGLVA